MANIGDLNLDPFDYRKPWKENTGLPSIPELVIGCPQGRTGHNSGKFLIGFLSSVITTQGTDGTFSAYRSFPFNTDWAPNLRSGDQFGQSIVSYMDVDSNGIFDFIIGAPGDDVDLFNNLTDTGAIYLMFIKREKYIWPIVDLTVFYVLVTVLPGCCFICCVAAIVAFAYTFRHKEDEAEKLAKEIGMSSIKLGESAKLRRTSSKIIPVNENEVTDDEKDIEAASESRPGSAKSDRPNSAVSDPNISQPNSPQNQTGSKKGSSKSKKSSKALIYHRQKTSLHTSSKKIDDFEDDERVDEYF